MSFMDILAGASGGVAQGVQNQGANDMDLLRLKQQQQQAQQDFNLRQTSANNLQNATKYNLLQQLAGAAQANHNYGAIQSMIPQLAQAQNAITGGNAVGPKITTQPATIQNPNAMGPFDPKLAPAPMIANPSAGQTDFSNSPQGMANRSALQSFAGLAPPPPIRMTENEIYYDPNTGKALPNPLANLAMGVKQQEAMDNHTKAISQAGLDSAHSSLFGAEAGKANRWQPAAAGAGVPSFQFVTGTDANGNAVVYAGNKKAGTLTPTGIGAKPSSTKTTDPSIIENRLWAAAKQAYPDAVQGLSDPATQAARQAYVDSHRPKSQAGNSPLMSKLKAAGLI